MVSVVIPSLYETDKDYLKLCAESLKPTGWEIIVITNGNEKSHYPHNEEQGQCKAVNRGAKIAKNDWLLISNSDMYYPPGWDKNLRFDFPVFSPNLVEPANNHGSAPPFLKADGGFTLEEFDKELVDTYIKAQVNNPENHYAQSGFNLPFFIKKDLWEFLGGYDENYDPWGSNSDTDLQTRINLAGITPMRLRDVLVYHFSNKTPTFAPENDAFRMNNFEYFYDKFGFDRDELGSDVWYNLNMIPEDKERIRYAQETYLP